MANRTFGFAFVAIATLAKCHSPNTSDDAAAPSASSAWRDDLRPRPNVNHELGSFGAASTFNPGDAVAALTPIAERIFECKRADGPTGAGHVKVTFTPGGTVSHVEVDGGPFDTSSAVTTCITTHFAAARIAPFSGDPVTVGKSFSI